MSRHPLLDALNETGFVLIPSLLTDSELTALRAASADAIDLARSGKWPHVRTLPKQFPPWPVAPGANPAENGIWGVQFMMHPSLPHSSTFIKSYFSSAVINIIKELLQCSDDELVLELYNLLVRPERDFELEWHRDDIPATASDEEELERLGKPAWSAQWNLALYDDQSLIVVPGSHRRARTAQERAAGKFGVVDGEIRVKQKAGDVAFYNNNIFHRGKYKAGVERMTLHGSMGHVGGSRLRARNVLQHGIGAWVGDIDLSGLEGDERTRAEAMRERLVNMGAESGDVGFSLEG